MFIEEKQKRMYAAERGQDYVMERFMQDLNRPHGYFQLESKLRLKIFAKIKEKSKQPNARINGRLCLED